MVRPRLQLSMLRRLFCFTDANRCVVRTALPSGLGLVTSMALTFAVGCRLIAAGGPSEGPLRVEATEDVSGDFIGAPRLHSFAWAQWNGKWIFIAGRTGGYHGVGQGDVDFPRARANQRIWVIEPPASGRAKVYSFPVADLPSSLSLVKDQWLSSNVLHFQDKDTLYLAGGYGENSAGELVTYSVVSSVNLPVARGGRYPREGYLLKNNCVGGVPAGAVNGWGTGETGRWILLSHRWPRFHGQLPKFRSVGRKEYCRDITDLSGGNSQIAHYERPAWKARRFPGREF